MSRLDHPLPSEATSGMDMQVEFLKDHPELVITPEWEIRFIGPGAPYGSRTMQWCPRRKCLPN